MLGVGKGGNLPPLLPSSLCCLPRVRLYCCCGGFRGREEEEEEEGSSFLLLPVILSKENKQKKKKIKKSKKNKNKKTKQKQKQRNEKNGRLPPNEPFQFNNSIFPYINNYTYINIPRITLKGPFQFHGSFSTASF